MDNQGNKATDEFINSKDSANQGLFSELLTFVKKNKKWWLLPIIIVIVGLALIIMLGGTAAAPFIYTLF